MAEEPGFFSSEGFPYPLLALGQTIPRGYQYQSERTPYKRDAKGDWGRALNESIDQFFGMWPQYMQQKRQFALQRDQLSRQRLADQHQAKLRPFELKQAEATQQLSENRMQMLKNYPSMVKSLPIPEKIKGHLLTLPPTEGLALMKTIMANMAKGRTKMIKAGQPDSFGNIHKVDLQQKDDGTLVKSPVPRELVTLPVGHKDNPYSVPVEFDPVKKTYSFPLDRPPLKKNIVPVPTNHPGLSAFPKDVWPFLKLDKTNSEDGVLILDPAAKSMPQNLGDVPKGDERLKAYPKEMWPFLKVDNTPGKAGQLVLDPAYKLGKEMQEKQIAKTAPSRSELFKTKHAPDKYANIRALGDLEEVAGKNLTGQRIAAVQLLPEGHSVRERAQDSLNEAKVKMGRNGVFVPESFGKDYGQPGRPRKPVSASAPKSIPVLRGNTLDQIVADFKAKGITVDPSQVVAANKHFFPGGDPNKMMTSADLGNAEMLIPVGGGSLSEFEVNAAHRSTDPRHNTTIIPGVGSYTNFNTTTVTEAIKLNSDLADMKKLQSNVDEVLDLMKHPEAISALKVGHPARGLIEGLRWRLINNVQTLRDFGVLSPSEITTIAKSVPDPNSWFNIVAGKAGMKPERFIEGVLGALKAEGITKANQLRAFMKHYSVEEIDFKIHKYNPWEGQQGQQGDSNQQLDNELSSFE